MRYIHCTENQEYPRLIFNFFCLFLFYTIYLELITYISHGQEKYQITDNTKIGKGRRNEEISGWNSHICLPFNLRSLYFLLHEFLLLFSPLVLRCLLLFIIIVKKGISLFQEKSRRQVCLDWIITWISWFKSTFYFLLNRMLILLSMEPWAAAKKTFSLCSGATSSCPGS